MGIKITRFYTKSGIDPFDSATYHYVSSTIKTAKGHVIAQAENIQMPTHWSQNACDIFIHKYLRRAGVPNKTERVHKDSIPTWLQKSTPAPNAQIGGETSVKQTIGRIAGCWTYHGWINQYFADEESAKAFHDEICYMFLHQIAAPNSPQWFNTGLYWAYGIEGNASGLHYNFDFKTKQIVQSTSAYKYPQVHACFILHVEDHLLGENGIMDVWSKEAGIFKYGSGAGANFSNIRGAGEALSGGGKSSGLMSFLQIGDRAAGAIKSGGTTRRAAKMVILDADHPDIEDFVRWKVKEEEKVLALVAGSARVKHHVDNIKQACVAQSDMLTRYNPEHNLLLKQAITQAVGDNIALSFCTSIIRRIEIGQEVDVATLSYDWTGEAYASVSGQNSNNSVRVTDAFLHAVEQDLDWQLIARTDGSVVKTISARKLWQDICDSAWMCADPGIQFQSTIDKWHTCPASGSITATNPCSEYVFLDNTACNLASINLDKMLSNSMFDTGAFIHTSSLLTLALEISVQMAQYPSYTFAVESHKFRTLGLGYTALGSMLMTLGLGYDSDDARMLVSQVTALMTLTAYKMSTEIAKHKGAFSEYDKNKEPMLRVMQLMHEHIRQLCKNMYFDFDLVRLSEEVIEAGMQYGYRNAQTTCIAPTGTISFVMDAGTTSCEPTFSLTAWKKLAGGGDMRILNPSMVPGLRTLGYTEQQIVDIKHYVFGTQNLKTTPHINYDSLNKAGFTSHMLSKINLTGCLDLSHAINKFTFTEDELRTIGSPEEVLSAFFSPGQIMEANLHCFGHLTTEGAPHLRSEHTHVFTCAVQNGVGVQSLAPIAHVKMLACIQPFISGACSKTVNMPEYATAKDVSDIYLAAWKMGVKCVAVYRNNCKFSQALNTVDYTRQTSVKKACSYSIKLANKAFYILAQEDDKGNICELEIVMGKEGSSARTVLDCFAKAISIGLECGVPLGKYVSAFKNISFEPQGQVLGYSNIDKALSPLDLLARVLEHEYPMQSSKHSKPMLTLGTKRNGKRCKVFVDEHEFIMHTGEDDNGRLAEVFFKISKEGSDFCALMSGFAKAISIALQYGVSLGKLSQQFIGTKFQPCGPVMGANITSCDSIIDFAFRMLNQWYATVKDIKHVSSTALRQHCSNCSEFSLKANGTCMVCENCGQTTGCS